MQKTKNILQWEGMLRSQRKHNRIVGSRCLQFKVERPTKSFPESQPPCAIQPNPKWRVNHQLHSAGFIKKSLDHQFLLGWNDAQGAVSRCKIIRELMSGSSGDG